MPSADHIPDPLRIIHLEDNPHDAELIRLRLVRDGFNVEITRVENHADFKNALERQPVDLILADCNLPSFDGFEALKITRAQSSYLAFLFVSGTLGEDVAVSSVKVGASDYVLKDQLDRLAPAVRRALQEARERNARRQANEQLRRSQQELADFFEHAPVSMHWAGPDGRILKANQAELDLLGYASAEYVGHHVTEFHEDPVAMRAVLDRLARGETVQNHEARMRCKNGSVINVLIDSNVLLENSAFVHTRSFTRDITFRKRAEEALRASENHYRLLFESSPTPIYVYDQESLGFLAVNEAAVLHYGYSREEFLSLTLRDIAVPDDLPAFLDKLARLVPESGNSGISRHRKKDGKLVETEITSHSLVFDGKKRGFRSPWT